MVKRLAFRPGYKSGRLRSRRSFWTLQDKPWQIPREKSGDREASSGATGPARDSFDVLNLLAHLLDEQLELQARVGELLRDRFRAEGVRFPVQFLHEEIQALADGAARGEDAAPLLEVRSQAVQLLGDVYLHAEEGDLLADALLVARRERLAQPRRDLLLVGGDRHRDVRLDLREARLHEPDALEQNALELVALARAA